MYGGLSYRAPAAVVAQFAGVPKRAAFHNEVPEKEDQQDDEHEAKGYYQHRWKLAKNELRLGFISPV